MTPTNGITQTTDTPRARANHAALARLYATRPQWHSVNCARDAVGLPDHTLLHAGAPYADPRQPSAPVLSSAVLCCLYEGWARTESEAEQLIANGTVKLVPAQSYGVVTPLAAVISPTTSLVEVSDAAASDQTARRAWSLLGSGAGAQIRFGSRDLAILARLAWRDTVLAPCLSEALATQPIDLLALAAAGLAAGDDLHARTTIATQQLSALLSPRLAACQRPEHGAAVVAMLQQTPLFFLTLWMAACHLMLDAASAGGQDAASTLVVALAGNGQTCGIRLAGAPDRWWTCKTGGPLGPRMNPASTDAIAALTGDSGVIDSAGFGAQALAVAPEIEQVFAPWLPSDWRKQQASLLAGVHPYFANTPSTAALRCGLDAAAIATSGVIGIRGISGIPPLAAIAMIAADGRTGLLGRGLYSAPAELFATAVAELGNA